ncbi:hypothetical protein EYF80_007178 [Liparis tanakae]|uniref:Uncharacterized protein n=1 Tax=Liparis tanakae TaxID=230148 RepID=A0A4Z2IXF2_9TELE|nr:hypothetical protein EYF80_007178 [Liparis tanakae]
MTFALSAVKCCRKFSSLSPPETTSFSPRLSFWDLSEGSGLLSRTPRRDVPALLQRACAVIRRSRAVVSRAVSAEPRSGPVPLPPRFRSDRNDSILSVRSVSLSGPGMVVLHKRTCCRKVIDDGLRQVLQPPQLDLKGLQLFDLGNLETKQNQIHRKVTPGKTVDRKRATLEAVPL